MGQAEHWGRIGGHVVLDLVDTISWRLDESRRIDRTPDFAHLIEWAVERGVISAAEAEVLRSASPAEARRATRAIHGLRSLATTLVDDHARSRGANVLGNQRGWGPLRAQLRNALAGAEPAPGLPLRWLIVIREPQDLARRLALEVDEFLRAPHPGLRVCEGPGCGWVFLDTSKNHSRRWCDPADCGNRVRVARHAANSSSAQG